MNDDALVRALQELFDADDPSDGLDRSDGLGEDYQIASLRRVPSDDGFDDVEITVVVGTQSVVSRLLFDRAWREASGLDDVGSYAAFILARWRAALVDDDARPAPSVEVVDLEEALRRPSRSVTRTSTGVLEVVDDGGDRVSVHVTPQQWRDVVRRHGDGVVDTLHEMIDSRWDDENHIVHFRGGLHRSVRPELPPVRSTLVL